MFSDDPMPLDKKCRGLHVHSKRETRALHLFSLAVFFIKSCSKRPGEEKKKTEVLLTSTSHFRTYTFHRKWKRPKCDSFTVNNTSFNESRGTRSFKTRIFGLLRRRSCISFRMESVDCASQLVRLDWSCWSCVMTFHLLATQAEIEHTLGWRDHIIVACPSMWSVRSANTARVTGFDRRRFSAFLFRHSLGKTFLWILSQVYQFLLQGATLCWLLLIVWRSRLTLCQRRRRLMLLTQQSCTFKMYFVCMG